MRIREKINIFIYGDEEFDLVLFPRDTQHEISNLKQFWGQECLVSDVSELVLFIVVWCRVIVMESRHRNFREKATILKVFYTKVHPPAAAVSEPIIDRVLF